MKACCVVYVCVLCVCVFICCVSPSLVVLLVGVALYICFVTHFLYKQTHVLCFALTYCNVWCVLRYDDCVCLYVVLEMILCCVVC